jgi:TDG/mug DNA glycosylase family protein
VFAVARSGLAPGLRVVFCGTAAGRDSASLGHYYAGTGNPFWTYLDRAKVTSEPLFPSTDHRVLEFGVGLTDLAKKVAASSDRGLRKHYDVAGFVAKMDRYQPLWVAFRGKEAAKEVSRALGHGGAVSLGKQEWGMANAHVFVLPSASGSNRDRSRLEGKADRVEVVQGAGSDAATGSAQVTETEGEEVREAFGVDLPAKAEPRCPMTKHRLCVVLVCHHAVLVVMALDSIAEDLDFQVAVGWWKLISWAVHLPARLSFAPDDRDQFARIVVIVGSDEGADWVFAATVVVDLENPDLLPRSVLYPGRLDVLREGERHPVFSIENERVELVPPTALGRPVVGLILESADLSPRALVPFDHLPPPTRPTCLPSR